MKPTFFATRAAFRAWLEANHAAASELLVGFHRKDSGKPSITYPEALDEALCYGWIDGVRRRAGTSSYTIRFTPRKAGSHWSLVNIRKAQALEAAGLMRPAGRAAFERRDESRTRQYSYEREQASFTPAQLRRFRAARAAWAYFEAQPPYYRRVATHYVTSAKREETRERRLARLIACSARGERLI